MRMYTPCMECLTNDGLQKMPAFSEFRDDGIYRFKCDVGHEGIVGGQQQHFEILSEIAMFAIVDGYYREAVASFVASMERYFEFFMRVTLRASGVEENVVGLMWKQLSNSSERQFGVYCYAYVQAFGEAPPVPSDSQRKFRNDVIHKGKIPSRDEAITQCQFIVDMVRASIWRLRGKYQNQVQVEVLGRLQKIALAAHEEGIPMSTSSMPTVLSLMATRPQDERSILDSLPDREWQSNTWRNQR